MKFNESLGQLRKRVSNEGARKPLRTISELAESLKMPKHSLSKILHEHNGPKSVLRAGGRNGHKNTWYEPEAVISFINAFKARTTEHCNRCDKDRPLSDFYMKGILCRKPCKECADTLRKKGSKT